MLNFIVQLKQAFREGEIAMVRSLQNTFCEQVQSLLSYIFLFLVVIFFFFSPHTLDVVST